MAMLDPSMFSMLARGMAGELPQGGLMGMLGNPVMLAPIASSAGFGEPQPRTEVAQRAKSLDGGQAANGDNSALPANATPTVGANFGGMLNTPPAMTMPPVEGGGESSWLDRNQNLLMGLGAGIAGGGTLSDSISKGLSGAASGMASDVRTAQTAQAQNMTMQALIARGMDPSQARAIASSPDLMKAVVPQLFGLNQTDDIKEYQFAKKEDPSLTFERFMARKKAVSGEFGMQPIWGTGPDGKPAVLQLGKTGEAKQSVLPQGFTLARDPIKVEGPTGTVILDPQTRQQVSFIPKDVAGAERQKVIGEAQGQAQVQLPGAVADAEVTSKRIDQLLANKDGLDSIVGGFDQYRPSWTLGESGRNALARLEQLQGGAFLQAFNMLKGGGAITEVEGKKAEQAIARLQRSQGETDFREALQDFRDAVNEGVRKLRARAGETGAYPDTIRNMGAPTAGAADPLNIRGR